MMSVVAVKSTSLSYEQFEKVLDQNIENSSANFRIKEILSNLVKSEVYRIYVDTIDGCLEASIHLNKPFKSNEGFFRKGSTLYVPVILNFKIHSNGISFYEKNSAPYEETTSYGIWKDRFYWRKFSLHNGNGVINQMILKGNWFRGPLPPLCGGKTVFAAIDKLK